MVMKHSEKLTRPIIKMQYFINVPGGSLNLLTVNSRTLLEILTTLEKSIPF